VITTSSAPTRLARQGNSGRLAKGAQARERIQRAIDLRLAGMSYADIAATLGYSDESSAYNAIWRELGSRTDKSVEQLRQVEGEKLRQRMAELERTIADPGPLVSAGKILDPVDRDVRTRAITAYARLSEQYAKLYGMNVPTTTVVQHQIDGDLNAKITTTITLVRYAAQVEALRAGRITVELPAGVEPPLALEPAITPGEIIEDDDLLDDDEP